MQHHPQHKAVAKAREASSSQMVAALVRTTVPPQWHVAPQGQRWRRGRPIASQTTTSRSRGGSCHRPPTGGPLCSTRLGRSGLAPCVSSELWRNGSRQVRLRGAGHPLVSTRHGVHGGRGACQWCWRRSWLRPSAAVQQGTTHPCERPMWPVFARW